MPDDAAKTTDATAASAAAAAPPAAAGTPGPTSAAKDAAASKADAAPTLAPPAVAAPGAGAKPTALAIPSRTAPDAKDAGPPAEETLIGVLDADQRIRLSAEQGERTLWAGAIIMTLLYTGLIASQALLGSPLSQAALEQERRRAGQDATAISVDLVPDPDKTSKTKKWREGEAQQTPTPNSEPPQPQQMASIAQPEVPEAEPKKEENKKDEPRPDGSPMLLDIDSLVDAAAADFKRNLDHALSKKPQKEHRQQQAMLSGGGMQVRGTGASGKSDAFSRSVIAALMKTRPGPFALWGRVLVSFEISPNGTLNYVHLLRSSGNSALDKAAVNAIHKARFKSPPAGLSADDRTYIIDYIFG